jgi:acyl-coenzyme A thioesterase PaaI-like protein
MGSGFARVGWRRVDDGAADGPEKQKAVESLLDSTAFHLINILAERRGLFSIRVFPILNQGLGMVFGVFSATKLDTIGSWTIIRPFPARSQAQTVAVCHSMSSNGGNGQFIVF